MNSNGKDEGGTHKDHRTDSRDDADKKRELGQIRSGGGVGCGSSGAQMQRDLWIRQTK